MLDPTRRALVALSLLVVLVMGVARSEAGPHVTAGERGSADREAVLRGEEATVRSFRAEQARVEYAEGLLGRALREPERSAIRDAHRIGRGERGRDGGRAGIHRDGTTNYTEAHILAKARRLLRDGFEMKDIRLLMDHGVVGDRGGRPLGALLTVGGLMGTVATIGLAATTNGPLEHALYRVGTAAGIVLVTAGVRLLFGWKGM